MAGDAVLTLMTVRTGSVQFKMVFMRSEKPICVPPLLSEVSPTLPLKQFQCSSDWRWPSLVLSRKFSLYRCGKKLYTLPSRALLVNLKGWAEEANRQTSWTTVRFTAERPLETLLRIVPAPLTYLASGLAGSADLLASRLFCQRQEDAAGHGTSHTHPQNAGCQNLQTSIN